HIITTPILRLAGTARTIADHNDYSVRAAKVCGDEVGVLTDAFNQMLAQIQSQDTALRENENKLAQAQAIAHLGYWERDLITDRLMWSSETKNEFLSRMSHELRTTLNAILGFGQLLERQKPTEVQRKRVGYILSAGKHLLDLINEVLDISRIEAGRMQLSLEPVCVADAL